MCSGPGEIGAALIRDYVAYDLASALQSAGVPIRCVNADKWPTNAEANRKYADFDAVILQEMLKPNHCILKASAMERTYVEQIQTVKPFCLHPETFCS